VSTQALLCLDDSGRRTASLRGSVESLPGRSGAAEARKCSPWHKRGSENLSCAGDKTGALLGRVCHPALTGAR